MKMDFSKIDNEITNVADPMKSLFTERDNHEKSVKAFDITTHNDLKTSFGGQSNM